MFYIFPCVKWNAEISFFRTHSLNICSLHGTYLYLKCQNGKCTYTASVIGRIQVCNSHFRDSSFSFSLYNLSTTTHSPFTLATTIYVDEYSSLKAAFSERATGSNSKAALRGSEKEEGWKDINLKEWETRTRANLTCRKRSEYVGRRAR